jgi:hypothetical protein
MASVYRVFPDALKHHGGLDLDPEVVTAVQPEVETSQNISVVKLK